MRGTSVHGSARDSTWKWIAQVQVLVSGEVPIRPPAPYCTTSPDIWQACRLCAYQGIFRRKQRGVWIHWIWTGNDGKHRAGYEATARTVKFLGRREGNGGAPVGEPPGGDDDLLPSTFPAHN